MYLKYCTVGHVIIGFITFHIFLRMIHFSFREQIINSWKCAYSKSFGAKGAFVELSLWQRTRSVLENEVTKEFEPPKRLQHVLPRLCILRLFSQRFKGKSLVLHLQKDAHTRILKEKKLSMGIEPTSSSIKLMRRSTNVP